jgi:hypothetical protein
MVEFLWRNISIIIIPVFRIRQAYAIVKQLQEPVRESLSLQDHNQRHW